MAELNEISNAEKVILSGVDWITYVSSQGEASRTLYTQGAKLAAEIEPHKDLWRNWQRNKFIGWQVSGVAFGWRDDNRAMVQMSGAIPFYRLEPLNAIDGKVTRVDLQVTLSLAKPDTTLAKRGYATLDDINRNRDRKRHIVYHKSTTGETLYVGKRSAPVFLRLYDKTDWIRPGHLGRYWRYEVEYKREAAQRAYTALIDRDDRDDAVVALVGTEFSKRGLPSNWADSPTIDAIATGAKISTATTKLAWLTKCVSPVVAKLCAAGYDDEVIHALHLKDLLRKTGGL